LNQPLAAISSYATGSINLLKLQARGGAALARVGGGTGGGTAVADFDASGDLELAMRRIAEQAERAGKVIKSVHDFVRRRDQEREPVAPRALLDAIMPLVSLQARKVGVPVQIRIEHDLPAVLCDHTMVEQVLLNLVRNAMQAMDQARAPHPSVLIEVRRSSRTPSAHGAKDWLEFSVSDVGPGIPAEIQQQLFTPFFTTKSEGMGLGLSLCRTVVEQHGGHLGFESNQPQGTIFRFTLPAEPPGHGAT
jgi:two-component system sensor histidine kinase DctS